MSEAAEMFNELLFGSGAIIGFILIVCIIALASYKSRIVCVCMIPVSIITSFMYFAELEGNNDLMWCGVMMLVMAIFLVFRAITTKE